MLVAALLLLVAACSSGEDADEGGGSDAEATDDAAQEPEAEESEAAEEPEAAEEGGASEAAEFYEGETLTLVVPFSPGGGYDTYTRLVAPFVEEYTGATVVVENQPGAGGLLAINELLADQSGGLRISIMNAIGAGGAAIAGAEGPQFQLDELSYVGRVAQEPHLLAVDADGPYQTFGDIIGAEGFRFGSAGPGAADFVNPSVLTAVFDLDAEIVPGFAGSAETELAVARGDVDGMTGDFDSRIGIVQDGEHRGVMVIGDERRDELSDVPTVLEQDMDADQESIMDAHLALMALGRLFVVSPDVPDDRLEFLRGVFEEMMSDPDLIAESETQGRPLNFLSGEEVDDLVATLLDAPDAYGEVLAAAYTE